MPRYRINRQIGRWETEPETGDIVRRRRDVEIDADYYVFNSSGFVTFFDRVEGIDGLTDEVAIYSIPTKKVREIIEENTVVDVDEEVVERQQPTTAQDAQMGW